MNLVERIQQYTNQGEAMNEEQETHVWASEEESLEVLGPPYMPREDLVAALREAEAINTALETEVLRQHERIMELDDRVQYLQGYVEYLEGRV